MINVGDKIIVRSTWSHTSDIDGLEGTVVYFYEKLDLICLDFGFAVPQGHNGGGYGTLRCCRYIKPEEACPVYRSTKIEVKAKDIYKIIQY